MSGSSAGIARPASSQSGLIATAMQRAVDAEGAPCPDVSREEVVKPPNDVGVEPRVRFDGEGERYVQVLDAFNALLVRHRRAVVEPGVGTLLSWGLVVNLDLLAPVAIVL